MKDFDPNEWHKENDRKIESKINAVWLLTVCLILQLLKIAVILAMLAKFYR